MEIDSDNSKNNVAKECAFNIPKTTAVVRFPSLSSPPTSGSVELIEPEHIRRKYGKEATMNSELEISLPPAHHPTPNAIKPYPNPFDRKSRNNFPEKKVGLKLYRIPINIVAIEKRDNNGQFITKGKPIVMNDNKITESHASLRLTIPEAIRGSPPFFLSTLISAI
jgi:hypothetical protein